MPRLLCCLETGGTFCKTRNGHWSDFKTDLNVVDVGGPAGQVDLPARRSPNTAVGLGGGSPPGSEGAKEANLRGNAG